MPPRYQAAAHRFLARITPSAVNGAGPARDYGHRLPEARPQFPDLATARDQIDRADATLDGLRQQGRAGRAHPRQVRPDIDGPRLTVLARQEHETQTVTLVVMEATTASIAIVMRADEREARIRKIEQISRSLPEGSYGRRNLER